MIDNKKGTFVVSLDFELLWGMLDHADETSYGMNICGGKKAIPKILDMFMEYGIHATWGIVGLIYHKTEGEMQEWNPSIRPTYKNIKLSTYHYMNKVGTDNRDYYFSPGSINRIRETMYQEIGSHTYSHYYCCETGQTLEQFEADLESAIKIADTNGDSVNSIIFPRNQYNPGYDEVLRKHDIKAYRGNEENWWHVLGRTRSGMKGFLVRGLRLLDSYINVSGNHCYSYDDLKKDGLLNIRSSRFLRPYSKKLKWLERFKVNRIKKQMSYAAKYGKIFHIWWHPHNFGMNMEENLSNLKTILEHYRTLNERYGFTSMNMQEVTRSYEDSDIMQ